MMDISTLIQDLFNADYDLFVMVKYFLDSFKKINDESLLEKLICHFDKSENKEEIWNLLLDYIDPKAINDVIFDYFWENRISILKLSHMDLSNNCLKKLSLNSEEAYLTLAKRYFYNEGYSEEEFINLMMNCRYESVFFNIIFSEKTISFKGLIIHNIINNNVFLSDEFKTLSQKVRYAKHLYCTDNEEEIKKAYENGDYIYMMAISQNICTPCCILENLSKVKDVKYASKIRKSSMQTIKLKNIIYKI